MKFDYVTRYESFIVVGILITFGTLIKIFGNYNLSSDWFWFLAGVGLVVEGSISLARQRKFDKKYRILEKEEYEKLIEYKKDN